MAKKITLTKRTKVAQMAVDKYKEKPFSFRDNRDCGKMAIFVTNKLGVGPFKISTFGKYTTAAGALKAIKKQGYDNLIDLMDQNFPVIAPAAALPCDIVAIPSEDDAIGALGISLGNGMVLAYHEEHSGAVVGSLEQSIKAWRVAPL